MSTFSRPKVSGPVSVRQALRQCMRLSGIHSVLLRPSSAQAHLQRCHALRYCFPSGLMAWCLESASHLSLMLRCLFPSGCADPLVVTLARPQPASYGRLSWVCRVSHALLGWAGTYWHLSLRPSGFCYHVLKHLSLRTTRAYCVSFQGRACECSELILWWFRALCDHSRSGSQSLRLRTCC